MSDRELQRLKAFRAEIPFVEDDEVERVLLRTVANGESGSTLSRRNLRRPRVLISVVAAALVLAGAGIAAVTEGPWWQSGAPPVDPQAVVSVARSNLPADVKVADARTVVADGDAALVAVPLDTSGYCLIPALDSRAVFDSPCVYSVRNPAQGDSDLTETASRAHAAGSAARWIAYGRITDPRAATIDLGAYDVRLATGGFFLTEIPEQLWQKLGGTANRGSILDSAGSVLRRGCVNWGDPPGTPPGSAHADTTFWTNQPNGSCKPQLLPSTPTLELGQARSLFDVTLTEPYSLWEPGQRITFERVPVSDGSACVIATGPGSPSSLDDHCGGFRLGPWQDGTPISTVIGAQLVHVNGKPLYVFDIGGSTNPAAGITRLTLGAGALSAKVNYDDGFFWAQLPATTPGPRIGEVPLPDGPWILTGYDAAGHEVTRVDLNALQKQASPH